MTVMVVSVWPPWLDIKHGLGHAVNVIERPIKLIVDGAGLSVYVEIG